MEKIKNPRSISVVVVASNVHDQLEATLNRLVRALTITVDDYEILVVDDTGTGEALARIVGRMQKPNDRIVFFRNPQPVGLARCLQDAARQAKLAFMAYVPAENSWPYRSFVSLFGNIGKADIITCYSTNLLADMTPFARVISLSFTRVINTLFGLHGRYYNGLTIYPIEFFAKSHFKARGFGIQAEALLRAIYAGYTFIELPLPVDRRQITPTGGVHLTNFVDASWMLVHTFIDLRVRKLTGVGSSQPAPPSTAPETGAKSILITGASSGIGAALAESLAAKGHKVYACARRLSVLQKVVGTHGNAFAFQCDVSKEDEVRSFAAAVKEHTPSLDVIINCAGGYGEIGRLTDTDSSAWMQTIQTNLFGTYLVIRHFLPLLKRSEAGRIINFSGGGAFNAFPNYSAYACSKAAVVRLTECLAIELLDDNISVNAIAPGILPTDVHWATVAAGESRAGQVNYNRALQTLSNPDSSMERVIAFVELLISDLNGLTGKTISVNYDPWSTASFRNHIRDITRSDLYSLRRVDVTNLPQGFLRRRLSESWSDYGTSD